MGAYLRGGCLFKVLGLLSAFTLRVCAYEKGKFMNFWYLKQEPVRKTS